METNLGADGSTITEKFLKSERMNCMLDNGGDMSPESLRKLRDVYDESADQLKWILDGSEFLYSIRSELGPTWQQHLLNCWLFMRAYPFMGVARADHVIRTLTGHLNSDEGPAPVAASYIIQPEIEMPHLGQLGESDV